MKLFKFEVGNRQNVENVENTFNIQLPDDYKNFLQINNGADVENGYFYVKDIHQNIPMGYFFGVKTKYKTSDIIEINKDYQDDILDSSVLIGNDIGSGLILLVSDGENDGIWYYDHTYFFPQSTDELNTYFICETFTEFMEMLETTLPQEE